VPYGTVSDLLSQYLRVHCVAPGAPGYQVGRCNLKPVLKSPGFGS
jgi:hypothetical protein